MTTSAKAKAQSKRSPEAISLTANSPEEREPLYARTILRPEVSAAATVRRMNDPASDDLTIDALIAELEAQGKAVNEGNLTRGEQMLAMQAHTLDSIFGLCARRSQLNMGVHTQAMEAYMRMALRAQSQCRATWETLAAMKNPPAVAFVRQTNIAAGPQQVNNGPTPELSRPREIENTPSKLLEAEHEPMHAREAAPVHTCAG